MKQMFAELTRQQGEIAATAALVATAAMNAAASEAEKKATIAKRNMELFNKNMMDVFMQSIREDKANTAASAEASTTADKTDKKYPSKPHENRIDPKQFSRVNKFEGGTDIKSGLWTSR